MTVTGNVTASYFIGNGSQLTNLTAVTKFATSVGDGTNTTYTVTHNLNSSDVSVTVRENSSGNIITANAKVTTANAVSVTFGSPATSNQYRVVVMS